MKKLFNLIIIIISSIVIVLPLILIPLNIYVFLRRGTLLYTNQEDNDIIINYLSESEEELNISFKNNIKKAECKEKFDAEYYLILTYLDNSNEEFCISDNANLIKYVNDNGINLINLNFIITLFSIMISAILINKNK